MPSLQITAIGTRSGRLLDEAISTTETLAVGNIGKILAYQFKECMHKFPANAS